MKVPFTNSHLPIIDQFSFDKWSMENKLLNGKCELANIAAEGSKA